MTNVRHRGLAIVLGTAALCGQGFGNVELPKRPADHKGVVIVGEWHHVERVKGPMFRTPKEFLGDLDRLNRMGFRPVTARAWLAGKMNLPKGASPVVVTFDDSHHDQFRLLKDGSVDPKCAVGLWQTYAKKHPEFPVKATFFVVSTMMWAQPEWVGRKLALLRKWGCEVANHTVNHPDLRRVGVSRLRNEIGGCALALEKKGERGPFDFAYPYGSVPRSLKPLRGFVYKKRRIVPNAAFLAGSGPSPMPGAKGFNRLLIPRILASGGRGGLNDWLDRVEKGKVRLYVQ